MTVRGANYERKKNDNYPTPPEAIDVLFRHVKFGPRILDPACGKLKRVVQAALRFGKSGAGCDIVFGKSQDFLKRPTCTDHDIVTNPPFGIQGRLTLQFIEQALAVTEHHRCRTAMLLPIDFDSGKTRAHVFQHPAFMLKLVLLDRIKWFNDNGGSLNHGWFVWDWNHQGPATIKYTRIEEARIEEAAE